MTLAAGVDIADIQKRGRDTRVIILIVFAIAAVSAVVELGVAPFVGFARGHAAATVLTELRDDAIDWIPMFILMGGLWSAQRVFRHVGEGEVFTAANAAGVGAIGQAMGWVGFAQVVLSPSLKAIVAHEGWFDLHLEGWAMLLAALGGAVVLFGRIWALAVEIKTDADQII